MQPFSKLALAVLLAHLLGDFPLQTSNIVQGKDRGSRAYLVHGGIHFLVLALCVAVFVGLELLGSLLFWIVVGVYVVVHVGIDGAKQGLVSTKNLADSASVFVVDQVLRHLHDYPVGMVFYATGLVKCEVAVQLVTRNRGGSS